MTNDDSIRAVSNKSKFPDKNFMKESIKFSKLI